MAALQEKEVLIVGEQLWEEEVKINLGSSGERKCRKIWDLQRVREFEGI